LVLSVGFKPTGARLEVQPGIQFPQEHCWWNSWDSDPAQMPCKSFVRALRESHNLATRLEYQFESDWICLVLYYGIDPYLVG